MLTHVSAWCDGAIPKVYEALTSTKLSLTGSSMPNHLP
jgi:hypothetical protein